MKSRLGILWTLAALAGMQMSGTSATNRGGTPSRRSLGKAGRKDAKWRGIHMGSMRIAAFERQSAKIKRGEYHPGYRLQK